MNRKEFYRNRPGKAGERAVIDVYVESDKF